jgi:hypothetical protein
VAAGDVGCGIDPDARKGERIEWPIWVSRRHLIH